MQDQLANEHRPPYLSAHLDVVSLTSLVLRLALDSIRDEKSNHLFASRSHGVYKRRLLLLPSILFIVRIAQVGVTNYYKNGGIGGDIDQRT